MAREDRERLSPRELLDGGIAALGAGAVCAAFVLAHIPVRRRESRLGSAFQLAYPIGFVVLVLIVVGAATVASKRSPVAWVALTAAFALLALGSALGAAVGMTVPTRILTTIQWPAATLLIAASVWADPGVPDPLAARKGIVVWIPALAGGAAIAVLLAATFMRVDQAATVLAAAALVLVMLRGIQRAASGDRGARANRGEPAGERSRVPPGRRRAGCAAAGGDPRRPGSAAVGGVRRRHRRSRPRPGHGCHVAEALPAGPGGGVHCGVRRRRAAPARRAQAARRPQHRDPRPQDGAAGAGAGLRLAAPRREGPGAPRHVRRRRACRRGREPVGGHGGRIVNRGAAAARTPKRAWPPSPSSSRWRSRTRRRTTS